MRSSTVNSPVLAVLTSTATMTSSNSAAARPMTSRWPLVTGSKDPGQTQRRTAHAVAPRVGAGRPGASVPGGATVPKRRLAVAAGTVGRRSRRARPSSPPRVDRSTTTTRARRSQPPARRSRRHRRARASSATVVRRVERTPRRTPAPARAGRRHAARPLPAPDLRRRQARASATLAAGSRAAARGRTPPAATCAAPRDERLQPDRAGPGVQVEHPRPAQRAAAATRGSRTAPRGPGRTSAGCPRPAARRAAGRAADPGDDPGHAARHALLQVVGPLVVEQAGDARRASAGLAGRAPGRRSTSAVGVLAGGVDDVLVAQHRAAAAGCERRPDCEAPSTSPSRRCSRSSRGQLEAVERGGDRVQPLAGRACPPRRSVTSRHRPGADPRPTRPRSWCSWETPNRSASMTTITVALGTSTPTSITVVATSTSTSPAAKRAHHVVLRVGGQPAVQHLDAQPGQRPLGAARERRRARRPAGRARARRLVGSEPARRRSASSASSARRRSAGRRRTPGGRPRPPRGPAPRPGRGSAASPPAGPRGW